MLSGALGHGYPEFRRASAPVLPTGHAPAQSLTASSQCESLSIASNLSWNTFLSRTSVTSLTRAAFSDNNRGTIQGLDDVLRVLKTLDLPSFRYNEIEREEVVGEGETYLVERCVIKHNVLAIKHLKINAAPNDSTLKRRLQAAVLELCVMRHRPLRKHPNIPAVFGYGWNQSGTQPLPFLLVQYSRYGTLRQYLHHVGSEILPAAKEILIGDVASGLSALHACKIIHGDVKMDNVLVFPSLDRPAKALAKLSDFGHSIIIAGAEGKQRTESARYGGTYLYNAPEVHDQENCPINQSDLHKCDVWAFGLLAWEVFLDGKEYITALGDTRQDAEDGLKFSPEECAKLVQLAKESIPFPKRDIRGSVLRAIFPMTMQWDPTKRVSNLTKLPVMTDWHFSDIHGFQGELALHLESSNWSYEMFSPETGSEIPWEHEEQIFLGLKRMCNSSPALDRAAATWQMALCYHVGFGTSRNASTAFQFAKTAEGLGHPAAKAFSRLLAPQPDASSSTQYGAQVAELLRESVNAIKPTQLGRAYLDKDLQTVDSILKKAGESPVLFPGIDFNVLHLLFVSEDLADMCLKNHSEHLLPLVDTPSKGPLIVHDQWPLHLLGSPLAIAISVNSVQSVKKLLELGANPRAPAYADGEFPENDDRSCWTPLHMAVKYHCSEILTLLLHHCHDVFPKTRVPYAIALAFSAPLERLAMHGGRHQDELNRTIGLLCHRSDITAYSTYGMTALMRAIDFQDAATVNALLQAKPSLARIRFINPFNRRQLTFPVHFAAQLASRRDTLDAVQILNIINAYSDKGPSDERSAYDQKGRTPLHLSVTGPSSRATAWLLDKDEGLLHVEDSEGRTALHCCASVANCDMLLKRGAVVDHADKQGLTALHTASLSGDVDIVRVLLSHKPKLDLKAKKSGTALHCAVIKGSMDVVMALIEAEVPVNELDVYGDTASHIAVRMARTSILRILIRHGADLSIRNSTRQTPKDLAKSIGTFDIIPILEILGGNEHAEKSAVSYGRWAEGGFSGLQCGARDESNGNARDDTSGRDEVEDSDGESSMPRGTSLDRILFWGGTRRTTGEQCSDRIVGRCCRSDGSSIEFFDKS
ncbi:Ankyrin repeat [Fusarium oxysporum f. sp. vasinfectum]|nr:Ankyrin repeat [Fusarium oxysporum f. sp. vasinfectum]